MQEKFKVHDDSVITDRDVISTRFNDYFIEIGPNLAKKIPNPGIQPKFYLKEVMVNSMFFACLRYINDAYIINFNLIDDLEKYIWYLFYAISSFVHYFLSTREFRLELCILDIQQPLCYLCNRSLIEGIFPCEMKIANVLL